MYVSFGMVLYHQRYNDLSSWIINLPFNGISQHNNYLGSRIDMMYIISIGIFWFLQARGVGRPPPIIVVKERRSTAVTCVKEHVIALEATAENIHNMSHNMRFPTMWHLTSKDSDEPLQPPFKPRNSKLCSASCSTLIVYSSDKQRL